MRPKSFNEDRNNDHLKTSLLEFWADGEKFTKTVTKLWLTAESGTTNVINDGIQNTFV